MIYRHHQSVSIWGHYRYVNSSQEIRSGLWERNLTKENQPVFIGPAQLISNSFVRFYDNSYFQLQVLPVVVASIKSCCRCCCCCCCQFNASILHLSFGPIHGCHKFSPMDIRLNVSFFFYTDSCAKALTKMI